jgi:hypothetical protein
MYGAAGWFGSSNWTQEFTRCGKIETIRNKTSGHTTKPSSYNDNRLNRPTARKLSTAIPINSSHYSKSRNTSKREVSRNEVLQWWLRLKCVHCRYFQRSLPGRFNAGCAVGISQNSQSGDLQISNAWQYSTLHRSGNSAANPSSRAK